MCNLHCDDEFYSVLFTSPGVWTSGKAAKSIKKKLIKSVIRFRCSSGQVHQYISIS